MSLFGSLLNGAIDLVFAPVCVACGGPVPTRSSERGVCSACWTRARSLPAPRCARCWMPLRPPGAGELPGCATCENLRPAIRFIRSAFLLHGPVRGMVHALKYRGWYSIAEPMGRRMASLEWPPELREELRLVIPVPLAPARLRQRGFNQAGYLAASVAEGLGAQVDDEVLLRDHSADSQTTLHPGERRANVAGAFRVDDCMRQRIAAEHLLLVDDVWTTGATALACADVLLDAGARAISIATFARALPELERLDRRLESAAIS